MTQTKRGWSWKELCEQDFGLLEGLPRSDQNVNRQLEELNGTWRAGRTDVQIDGGESPDDVLARASTTQAQVLKKLVALEAGAPPSRLAT